MKNGYTAIPDWLLYGEDYSAIPLDSKVLYSAIKRRTELSATKGDEWKDKDGKTFCFFSSEAVQELTGCSKGKALSMLKSLEDIGLITRINHGQGKPAYIYLHEPKSSEADEPNDAESQKSKKQTSESSKNEPLEVSKANSYKFKNNTSASSKAELPEVSELHPSYKECSYPEASYPNPSNPFNRLDRKADGISTRAVAYWRTRIREQVGYDALKEYAPGLIDDITETMAHIVLSRDTSFPIGGTTYSAEVVKQKVLSANWHTVKYIIDCLRGSHTIIRNPHAYLLQCIMRADSTSHIKYAPCGVNRDE